MLFFFFKCIHVILFINERKPRFLYSQTMHIAKKRFQTAWHPSLIFPYDTSRKQWIFLICKPVNLWCILGAHANIKSLLSWRGWKNVSLKLSNFIMITTSRLRRNLGQTKNYRGPTKCICRIFKPKGIHNESLIQVLPRSDHNFLFDLAVFLSL